MQNAIFQIIWTFIDPILWVIGMGTYFLLREYKKRYLYIAGAFVALIESIAVQEYISKWSRLTKDETVWHSTRHIIVVLTIIFLCQGIGHIRKKHQEPNSVPSNEKKCSKNNQTSSDDFPRKMMDTMLKQDNNHHEEPIINKAKNESASWLAWAVFLASGVQVCFWIYLFVDGRYVSSTYTKWPRYHLDGYVPIALIVLLIAAILVAVVGALIVALSKNEKSFIGLWMALRKAEMESRLTDLNKPKNKINDSK